MGIPIIDVRTSRHSTAAGLVIVATATAPLAPGKVARLGRTVDAETLHGLLWTHGPKILDLLESDVAAACERKAYVAFGFPTDTVFTIS
jgi:hypothetical protein